MRALANFFSENRNSEWMKFLFLTTAIMIMAWLTANTRDGYVLAIAPALIGFGAVYLAWIFHNPRIVLYSILVFGFMVSFLGRFLPIFTWGLVIDILLVTGFFVVIWKNWREFSLKPANRSLTWVYVIWMGFVVLELFNPQATSTPTAWFYAMRGIGLYSMLMVPLMFILMDDRRHMDNWTWIMIGIGMIGGIYAMKQIYIGLFPVEEAWLRGPAGATHILFGQLRAFSFFTDAAQFGASMAHIALIALIYGYSASNRPNAVLYFFAAFFCLYGMLLSGSRGPLAIPAIGGLYFLLLSKQYRIFFLGLIFAGMVFGFLKFTSIGQSNYYINRMRTALNPSDDPSFQVRKIKEKKIAGYLASRPLGGGIGSAGFWGMRFTPHTFLAQTPTDGLYYRIWMEGGIVGLTLYIGGLIYLLVEGTIRTLRIRNTQLRLRVASFIAGFLGLAVASYTNELLVQMPTGLIVYGQLAFVWMSKRWDDELWAEEERRRRKKNLIYDEL